jgi:dihydrofolate reductase
MSGTPGEIVSRLAAAGARHVYVDGGITIQRFLSAGLIDRLVVSRVPVLIGSGIPLFGALPRDVRLRHVATRAFEGGLVQSEYEVRKAGGAGEEVEGRVEGQAAEVVTFTGLGGEDPGRSR